MTVTIDPQTQRVASHNHLGPGRGSLTLLSEQRGVDLVNQLSVLEMICAYLLARNGQTAFPLGRGAELYAHLLAKAEAWVTARAQAILDGQPLPKGPIDEDLWAEIEQRQVGYWRQFMVHDIGSSFNGPLDSYLEVACDHKRKASAMVGLEGAVETTERGY